MTPFLHRLVDSARGAAPPAVRPRVPLPFEHAAGLARPDIDRIDGPEPAPHSRPGDATRVGSGTSWRAAPSEGVDHADVQEVGPARAGAADSPARPAARRLSRPADDGADASAGASGTIDLREPRDHDRNNRGSPPAPAARIAKASAAAPVLEATDPMAGIPEAAPRPARIRHATRPALDAPATDASVVRPASAAEPSARDGGGAAGDGRTQDAVRRRVEVRPRAASIAQTPARAAEPRADGGADTAPVVHITIGRIDVRAVHDAPRPAAPPKRASAAPRLSLDEYLRQRSGGER